MKYFLFFLLLVSTHSFGQKLKKADKATISDLKRTVTFLADDKLEGRRTGTPGEKLAYEFLEKELRLIGLLPKGDNNTYLQTFEINEGKEILPGTSFLVDGNKLDLGKDFFPFIFSANGNIDAFASPAIRESEAPWFLDIKEMLEKQSDNPHFDLADAIKTEALQSQARGANALIIFNSGNNQPDLNFNGKSKTEALDIPVVFVKAGASKKYFAENNFFTIKQDKKNFKKSLIAAIAVVILSTILVFFLGKFEFDFETLAFELTVPAIGEEIMYRGILLGLLMTSLKAKIPYLGNPAVLLTAILFGFAHGLSLDKNYSIDFNALYIMQTGFAGYIWGWIAMKSRSVLLAILSHNFGNFFGTLSAMIK